MQRRLTVPAGLFRDGRINAGAQPPLHALGAGRVRSFATGGEARLGKSTAENLAFGSAFATGASLNPVTRFIDVACGDLPPMQRVAVFDVEGQDDRGAGVDLRNLLAALLLSDVYMHHVGGRLAPSDIIGIAAACHVRAAMVQGMPGDGPVFGALIIVVRNVTLLGTAAEFLRRAMEEPCEDEALKSARDTLRRCFRSIDVALVPPPQDVTTNPAEPVWGAPFEAAIAALRDLAVQRAQAAPDRVVTHGSGGALFAYAAQIAEQLARDSVVNVATAQRSVADGLARGLEEEAFAGVEAAIRGELERRLAGGEVKVSALVSGMHGVADKASAEWRARCAGLEGFADLSGIETLRRATTATVVSRLVADVAQPAIVRAIVGAAAAGVEPQLVATAGSVDGPLNGADADVARRGRESGLESGAGAAALQAAWSARRVQLAGAWTARRQAEVARQQALVAEQQRAAAAEAMRRNSTVATRVTETMTKELRRETVPTYGQQQVTHTKRCGGLKGAFGGTKSWTETITVVTGQATTVHMQELTREKRVMQSGRVEYDDWTVARAWTTAG
jgi:hypothetical protein